MISEQFLSELAEFIKDRVKTAEVIFDGKAPETVQILRKDVVGNLLRVHVQTTKGVGTIKDIRLKDAKGDVIISKPRDRVKTTGYALVSSFYIRVIEEEIDNPINIFEMKEGLDG